MAKYQLAHVNVARALAAADTETMKGFVSRLDEINAIADQAPGFVWRLQSEDGDDDLNSLLDDELMLINMSVWDSVESLRGFVYQTMHSELIQGREAWFSKLAVAHQALWWIPAGHIPSEEEAGEKLACLREHGPSQQAFTFGKSFPQP